MRNFILAAKFCSFSGGGSDSGGSGGGGSGGGGSGGGVYHNALVILEVYR